MEDSTFKSRLIQLMQKSRQALRLYDSVARSQKIGASEYGDLQAKEWREINNDLLKTLGVCLEYTNPRHVSASVLSVKDRFQDDYRVIEAHVYSRQRELISASEHGDFIKAAQISKELISAKAKMQATHAVFHELDELLSKTKASDSIAADYSKAKRPIELHSNLALDEKTFNSAAKLSGDRNTSNASMGASINKAESTGSDAVRRPAKVLPLKRVAVKRL